MRQSLRMFAAMILMASGFAAHAGQTEYDPAKVSDSLKAVFKFGSVSTKKAMNANTVDIATNWMPSVKVLGELRSGVITYRNVIREHMLAETLEDSVTAR